MDRRYSSRGPSNPYRHADSCEFLDPDRAFHALLTLGGTLEPGSTAGIDALA